tara:strand:- start:2304 stop:3077 length:774 start_codon:yes stop_codon:yes gene_type:complete
MDNNPELLEINNEMLFNLNLNPEDLAQKLLKAKGIEIKEFKIGDEETSLEKTLSTRITEKGIAYRSRMNQQITQINQIIMIANKTIKPDELKDLENQLNLLRVDVNNYNKLAPIDKVGLEVKHAQLQDMLNEAFTQIQDKEQEISQGLPVTPLQDLNPSDPVPFDPPQPKPKPDGDSKLTDKNLKIVKDYVNNVSKNYSAGVRNALLKLPNSQKTYNENEKTKKRNFDKVKISQDIRENTLNFLKNQGLFEDKKPSA